MITHKTKPNINVFLDYYLPGNLAGGPIRTIANMVKGLSNDFNFKLVTRDRDLGEKNKYDKIKTRVWINKDNNSVMYINPFINNLYFIKLLKSTEYDLIYLNSFFSYWATLNILIYRKLGLIKNVPIILAPRGEFSPSALEIKKKKKYFFIKFANFFNLYNGIIWQASSEDEKTFISTFLDVNFEFKSVDTKIFVAPDLVENFNTKYSELKIVNKKSKLHVLFLSRIVRIKNLNFLINVLSKIDHEILFSIYGPAEDYTYWLECQELLSNLPKNINWKYHGPVEHERIHQIFEENDVMFLPTKGENFGHVIFEALQNGLPVVLSNKTLWKTHISGCLKAIPLIEDLWINELYYWIGFSFIFFKISSAETFAVPNFVTATSAARFAI